MEAVHQAGGKGRWSFGSGMPARADHHGGTEASGEPGRDDNSGTWRPGRWRLGRIAEEVIRSGRLPVLVAPSSAPSVRVAHDVLEVADSFQQQEVQP